MDVSPNVLRRETVGALKQVNDQLSNSMIQEDPRVMSTLLLAKVTALNTLVQLRTM